VPISHRFSQAVLVGMLSMGGCAPYGYDAQLPTTASAEQLHDRSWMLSEARSKPLIYISTVQSPLVYVYAFDGNLVGELNVGWPQGECVDKAGDVWITDTASSKLVKYAHGGTKPIATLTDPGQQPAGCSVDPRSGDLAVANICSALKCGDGNLAVYAKAKGTPRTYFDSSIDHYYQCAYDGAGNVLVSGKSNTEKSSQREILYAELHNRASKLQNVSIAKSLRVLKNVQWAGRHYAIEGFPNHKTVIYHISIDAHHVKIVGLTSLERANPIDFFIADGEVLSLSIVNVVTFWHYPSGEYIRSFKLDWFVNEPDVLVVSFPPS
jgi:hypothetical protein